MIGIDLFLSKHNKDDHTDTAGCSSGCGKNGISSKATSSINTKNKENDDMLNKDVETMEIPNEGSDEEQRNQESDEQGSEQEENQGSDEEQENHGSEEEQEVEESEEESEDEESEDEDEDEGPNGKVEDEQHDQEQESFIALLGDDIAEVESD